MTIGRLPRSRRQGYLLVEMMLLLSVVGVFALVAGKLMVTTMKLMAQTQRRQDTARRFDLAMQQLRGDVWSAQRIEADGQSVTLAETDGRKVVWQAEPELADDALGEPDPFGPSIRLVRRVERNKAGSSSPATMPAAPTDVTRWGPLPAGISFAAEGPTLATHVPATDDRFGTDPRSRITMVSEMELLAGRGR